MSHAPTRPVDPLGWCALLALAFFGLTLIRLTIPSAPYFDEAHYLPAARALLELSHPLNREHPLVGKEIIAAGIALFGDNSFGWRIFSAVAGAVALFAGMRAIWLASRDRFATLAFGILLATGFHLFVHSRIAMLDVFMVMFSLVSLWQFAAAISAPERGRWHLALSGIAMGLALGAKWNAIPLAVVPGITFLIIRLQSRGLGDLFSRRGAPVPGIGLAEATIWLGAVPLLVYAATFLPACFYTTDPLAPGGLIAFHQTILDLQQSVKGAHPYQSTWPDWIINRRPIWYLYHVAGGAQRGVMMVGNPLTMLLGLPALLWCAWAGLFRQRRDALAVTILFAATFGFWIVAAKPVQFYYHYFLPSCFLLAGLALALGELRTRGWGWLSWLALGGSAAMFAYYFPILSAAPLPGLDPFEHYAWFKSWV